MKKHSGACLCGKVTYTTKLKSGIGACHCGMCRKWSGGIFMAVHAEGEIDVTGEENIGTYRSSEWAERAFCKACGTNLYYRLLPHPAMPSGETILSAGSLDTQENLVFDHEVYVDHNPDWYKLEGEENRHRMTEAEIVAMYGDA